MTNLVCPHCNVLLERVPQRRTTCKSCGQRIYVRTLPATREQVLLTESQAAQVDAAKEGFYQRKALSRSLEMFHIPAGLFEERRGAATEGLSDRNIAWALLHERTEALRDDLQALASHYYSMALFAAEADREFRSYLQLAHRTRLQVYARSSVIRLVEISSAGKGNACESCERHNEMEMTIAEALRTMPLPCRECTMVVVGNLPGFCRCEYVPVL